MFGNNPKRVPSLGNSSILFVKSIFKTLQGEGPFFGIPSIFIRLGGCNLACKFCDTEFEDFEQMDLNLVLQKVQFLSLNSIGKQSILLVVITGGEPFRQPISLLCQKLIDYGFCIQIETNGTLYQPLPKEVEIVCSPKVVNGKYLKIREDLLCCITAFKFIISKSMKGYDNVPELGQINYGIPVFLQPMDQYDYELNNQNRELAVDLALNKGYRLSYQMHKVLGID